MTPAEMHPYAEAAIAALLVMAGAFGLVGSFGLLKLPELMTRLHAPTKATTLGVGGVLIASMLAAWFGRGEVSWHELLITMFLLLTAPITANFMAKAQMHREMRPSDLPPTGVGTDWATFVEEAKPVEPAASMVRTPGD